MYIHIVTHTSTPQLPFKTPQIPSNRDYKAPNRGTLGGLGLSKVPYVSLYLYLHMYIYPFKGALKREPRALVGTPVYICALTK